ncbi:Gustatory receptor 48 [Halyomorpha halys]|nr:Gustatory receptor 48 [Halyomorpha halys]
MERNGIFRISTFFGIFPFRRRDNALHIDNLLVFYSFIFNITIGAFHSYYLGSGIWHSNLKSYHIYLCLGFYGSHTLILLRFPVNIYNEKQAVVKTIHDLNSLGSFYQEMGLEIKTCYRKRTMLFDMLAPLLCGIVFYITGNTHGSIMIAIGLTVALLEIAMSCGQFCFLVDTVSDFFDSGMKLLVLIAHPVTRSQNMRTTERFISKTGRLISVLRSVNTIYSKQILLSMTGHFVSIIIQLYYVFYNSTTADVWRRFCIPGDLLMLLYRFYSVWRLSHSAAQAGNMSREFNTLLYQTMIDDKTDEILRNDILRLHISMKRDVVFTACGFFNLDYTLVHSMIASATTYLVILIQFE